jgi:hypothetical protein
MSRPSLPHAGDGISGGLSPPRTSSRICCESPHARFARAPVERADVGSSASSGGVTPFLMRDGILFSSDKES